VIMLAIVLYTEKFVADWLIVYITHNVSEAIYLGDQIIFMDKQGTVKANIRNEMVRPRDPLSDEFVKMQRDVLNQLTHLD
jgi:ABC-type nitrate/sulfonate/bicarbonate transport system ATPase subunit